MRTRFSKIALVGAIAAAFAFTAVPSQIMLAASANARVLTEKPQTGMTWNLGQHSERSNHHCKVYVLGSMVDC